MIDLDPPVCWWRAALSAVADLVTLAFGLAGIVSIAILVAAVMGTL